MEASEAESESLARRIAELYQRLHPSDNLSTIPGVGPHTAPIFIGSVGDPARFRNQSAFANWEGVVPGARQFSNVEAKGLRNDQGWAIYHEDGPLSDWRNRPP
jgi:transposase